MSKALTRVEPRHATKLTLSQEQKNMSTMDKVTTILAWIVVVPLTTMIMGALLPIAATLVAATIAMGVINVILATDIDGPSGTCTSGWSD